MAALHLPVRVLRGLNQDCREQLSAAMLPVADRLLTSMGDGQTGRAGNQADRRITHNCSEADHD